MPAESSESNQIDTVDSLSTMTVSQTDSIEKPFVAAFPSGLPDTICQDVNVTPLDRLPIIEQHTGLEAQTYTYSHEMSSIIMTLLMLSFLFVSLSFRNGISFIGKLFRSLYDIRERKNVFDDITINESLITWTMNLNTCIYEGIIIFEAIQHYSGIGITPSEKAIALTACLSGTILYLLFQKFLYSVLGYTFGGNDAKSTAWMAGFDASQGLLGITLLPIAAILTTQYFEQGIVINYAILLYILARLVFILKGYRIFFSKINAQFYFILYLCIAELSPLVVAIAQIIYFLRN